MRWQRGCAARGVVVSVSGPALRQSIASEQREAYRERPTLRIYNATKVAQLHITPRRPEYRRKQVADSIRILLREVYA